MIFKVCVLIITILFLNHLNIFENFFRFRKIENKSISLKIVKN